MKFTEAKLEKAFTELLENENFPHQSGITISRSATALASVWANMLGC